MLRKNFIKWVNATGIASTALVVSLPTPPLDIIVNRYFEFRGPSIFPRTGVVGYLLGKAWNPAVRPTQWWTSRRHSAARIKRRAIKLEKNTPSSAATYANWHKLMPAHQLLRNTGHRRSMGSTCLHNYQQFVQFNRVKQSGAGRRRRKAKKTSMRTSHFAQQHRNSWLPPWSSSGPASKAKML